VGALMKVFKNIFLSGNKYSTIFFIAGVFVSMLITSVGISTSIAYQQLMNTRYELEGEQYQLIVNPNGKLTDSFWDRLYNVLIDDSGLYINQINIPTSYASDYIPRSYPLLFKGNKGIFPLLEGKYFSYENVKNKDRIALVGKDAVLLLPEINGKRYVKLSGTSYEVIGVIGEKNKKTVWDKSVYFPINCKRKITKCIDKIKSNFQLFCRTLVHLETKEGSLQEILGIVQIELQGDF